MCWARKVLDNGKDELGGQSLGTLRFWNSLDEMMEASWNAESRAREWT